MPPTVSKTREILRKFFFYMNSNRFSVASEIALETEQPVVRSSTKYPQAIDVHFKPKSLEPSEGEIVDDDFSDISDDIAGFLEQQDVSTISIPIMHLKKFLTSLSTFPLDAECNYRTTARKSKKQIHRKHIE